MMIKPIRQTIKLESRTESLKLFRQFVQQTVSQAHLDAALTRHVVLASDEAITSIIRHASANHRVGSIEVDIDVWRNPGDLSRGDRVDLLWTDAAAVELQSG